LPSISVADLSGGRLPLVVCVSADPAVRERLVRQLDGGGIVLMCPDLNALRRMLAESGAGVGFGGEAGFDGGVGFGGGVAGGGARGGLVIDAPDHQVTWRGRALPLTRLEWELVARLGTEPVRVWTYERLFAAVWGGAYLGDNSILHSAVKRLRRKLRAVGEGIGVETVRGVGYRLVVP
jgi:two-component system, OmpR family, response regulator MtrA